MEHALIERHDVIDRYLAGRLPEQEEAGFEEHLLSCNDCFEQVKLDDDFRGAFRALAAGEATRAVRSAAARSRWAAWLSGPRAGLVAAGVLALTLVPSVRLWQSNQDLRQQAERAGAGIAAAEARASESQQELEVARSQLSESRTLADAELRSKQELEQALRQQRSAQINTPIHFLDGVRGAGSGPRLGFRKGSDWLLLAVELPYAEHAPYRAELLAGGQVLWKQQGLEPDDQQRLVISLHREQLAAGSYRLKLQGLAQGGRRVDAGVFPFQVAEGH